MLQKPCKNSEVCLYCKCSTVLADDNLYLQVVDKALLDFLKKEMTEILLKAW